MLNNISENAIEAYFSKYGKVVKVTKQRHGKKIRFAYVVFDDCESVDRATQVTIHKILDEIIDIRKAHCYN